jgi:hypothetical protein
MTTTRGAQDELHVGRRYLSPGRSVYFALRGAVLGAARPLGSGESGSRAGGSGGAAPYGGTGMCVRSNCLVGFCASALAEGSRPGAGPSCPQPETTATPSVAARASSRPPLRTDSTTEPPQWGHRTSLSKTCRRHSGQSVSCIQRRYPIVDFWVGSALRYAPRCPDVSPHTRGGRGRSSRSLDAMRHRSYTRGSEPAP